jgi:hypothetical protein
MFTWVCPTCGRELDLSTKECPDCTGKPAAGAPPPPPISPAPVAYTAPPEPAAAPGQSRLLMAGIALLALAAVFIGWAVLRGRSAEPATKPVAPEAVTEPAADSPYADVEISGLRPFYDAKNQPQVHAVIINHGAQEMHGVSLRVALRPRRAPAGAPPLARFLVKIPVLKAETSQEISVPLEAFGTLASLPAWRELRADFE